MRSAGTTLRKLASGSPIPISTTLLTRRSSPGALTAPGVAASARCGSSRSSSRTASHTCPTISAVLRLRLKPCRAVAQNEQSSTQPTCEEMHSVPRSGSGMNTISNAWAASARSSHLRVPSPERCCERICGARTSACAASSVRKSLARSVMSSNEPTPRLYIQFISWRARNGWPPSRATKLSSAARGSPSRLVRGVAADVMAVRRALLIARMQLRGAEEVGDLARRGVGRVRAVHHVALDAGGEVGADRAGVRLLRIGRAHDVAVAGDRALALQHLHDDGARSHVAHQVLEERTLAVHGVEAFSLALRQVQHACGDDCEACVLETAIDLADEIGSHAVGLDDGQGALERHSLGTSDNASLEGAGVRARQCAAVRGVSREVYLGFRTRGNLACDGSAGLVRLFARTETPGAPVQARGRATRPRALQTEKLSPQPHSPLTLGLLKRKASFRPCLTKSTIVPSMSPRLAPSTNTRTPRSSNTASPGCGPSA